VQHHPNSGVAVLNQLDFSGRQVLIVGGSSGIGNGIAQAFRAHGAEVCVWGTRACAEDYAGVPDANLAGLHFESVDVTDFEALEHRQVAFDRLDVLVLSQGTVIYKRGEFTIPGFTQVVDVNLNSVMACAIKFHSRLEAVGGSMIVISSTGAFSATRGNPAYSASKSALLGLVRTLGAAWAAGGVRVNGIAHGLVDSKLTKVTTDDPKRLGAMLDKIPLARLGTPSDIAGAALFLASPMASYIVGQTIIVDGGMLLS
jgi:3-oxoacyl-[acyl-carrier protein] reductase